MEQRIDRIEKAIEEMIETRKNDRILIERHDKILTNLEANQIVMGKAMEGIKTEVSRLVNIMSNFMDMVGYKFKDHEERIEKLENK
ncbi:MAG: hypothetical protein ABRQ39_27220 [Candidatus Eremiobacterota bacterium]